MGVARSYTSTTVTIASGAALTAALDVEPYVVGVVRMPAAWTTANIGFKVAGTQGGTYLPLYDRDGYLVQIVSPVADRAYDIPVEACGAQWIKLWSQNGSGTDTNQSGDRSIGIDLKS